jgi:Uma2 family endonuclease
MTSILDNPAIRQAVLPVSVEQYHRLGETGLIPENTELLKGVIVGKMIKSPMHSWLVQFLIDWFRANLPPGLHVRQEQPLTFSDSEPEPDVAVVSGSPDDYRSAHPTTAILVIEVAVSSAELDREKANVYAAAGVPEYLIVLPDEKRVEVHREPQASGYSTMRGFGPGEILNLSLLPRVALPLGSLLGDSRND